MPTALTTLSLTLRQIPMAARASVRVALAIRSVSIPVTQLLCRRLSTRSRALAPRLTAPAAGLAASYPCQYQQRAFFLTVCWQHGDVRCIGALHDPRSRFEG